MPKEKPKPEQVRIFKTTIRGTETIIYDRKGKPRKLQRMRRYRKPLIYEEFDFKRNPDKTIIASVYGAGKRKIEFFAYKNADGFGVSCENEYVMFDREDTVKFMRAICRLGNFFRVLSPFKAKRKRFEKRKGNIKRTREEKN